jgi:hypothetical protein
MSLRLPPEGSLVSEAELRESLHPCRIDDVSFEAGIRARIQCAEANRADAPLLNAPQLLKVAAAVLPLPAITGGKVAGSAALVANASIFNKLLGFAAMPAVSLFVLPAAAILGAARIRSIQGRNVPGGNDPATIRSATALWARRHKWFLHGLYWGTLGLAWIGATSLMLLLYLISLGALLHILLGFAKLHLANRYVIGQSCMIGLVLLGQVSGFSGIGDQDIHFVDQLLVAALLVGGGLAHIPFLSGGFAQFRVQRFMRIPRWFLVGLFTILAALMAAWLISLTLWPVAPEQIKNHAESFDEAPFSSASWRQWEIVASWTLESKLDPDLSGPRRLLAREIAGEQNPFILGNAFRVGLVQADQVGQLKDYDQRRRSLIEDPYHVLETRPILSLAQEDWVIRASVLRNDLSARDRDYLEKRLHVTLADLAESPTDILETALRVTQLLAAIQRPLAPDRYRDRVHDWLRKLHCKKGGGLQLAGGFRQYPNSPVGSVDVTSYAVELMQVYGIPDGLDLNWVRSFLRPRILQAGSEDRWVRAVTLDRLNHLPGVKRPSWLEVVYYERSLIMAALLVALCLYATISSPLPDRASSATASTSATQPGAETTYSGLGYYDER